MGEGVLVKQPSVRQKQTVIISEHVQEPNRDV